MSSGSAWGALVQNPESGGGAETYGENDMRQAVRICIAAGLLLLLTGCGGPCSFMPGPFWEDIPDRNCGFTVL